MQKNYSRGEAYARGYFHHIKGHLTAGAIIAIVMFVLHLLSAFQGILVSDVGILLLHFGLTIR